jgi:ACT domain-containing protein
MRRADDAWAIQMERAPKKRKTLILIGIVCDDEIKDTIDIKAAKDRSKMVLKN